MQQLSSARSPSSMQQQPSVTQPKQQQEPTSPPADSQFIKAFVAGGGAGLLAALITCPVEVVKTKLQAFLQFFSSPFYI
jgi:hypothetical protein